MIRKATHKDIIPILEITKSCAKILIANHILQWSDLYPNEEAFELDIQRNELYVKTENNKVIGCIAISSVMDEEYKSIDWKTFTLNNIYIHRLSIHPDHQGKGHARQLMAFAEDMAKDNKAVSIRLDTFSQNKKNQKFYELRGYERLGNVYFHNQSDDPFYCYELIL